MPKEPRHPRHAIRSDSIEPCDKARGVDYPLDGLHVLFVAEQRPGVRAVKGQQVHQLVGVIKNKVASVDVLHMAENGQRIVLGRCPRPLGADTDRLCI